ncbi:MAG TPA: hypothetical protein VIY56_17020 [Vicinamibacterales bacterium]
MLAGQSGDYAPSALHQVPFTGQQLFLADTQRRITRNNPGRAARALVQATPRPRGGGVRAWAPAAWPVHLELFHLPLGDVPLRILHDDAPRLAWFAHLEPAVTRIGLARGWSGDTRLAVALTLEGVVATHEAGTPCYLASRVALAGRGTKRNAARTIELLAELGRLDDDRPDPLQQWLENNLSLLPPGFRSDVAEWLDALRNGTKRRRPKAERTWQNYLLQIRPILLAWSADHETLREISRAEVVAALTAPTPRGGDGHTRVTALRSLFAFLKIRGKIFADPCRRLDRTTTRRPEQKIPTRLPASALEEIGRTPHTPATWLIIVLTGHHALGPAQIQALTLQDVDLANFRLAIQGSVRPLDRLTRQAIELYLAYRTSKWPSTANPHLLITQQTAHHERPVSRTWLGTALRGQQTTLSRLRQDRILDEAEAVGVRDPLHLAAVFGLRPVTAQRYADAVHGRLDRTNPASTEAEPTPS